MGLSFTAQDNQFATATGRNIGAGPDRSNFDAPPGSATSGLVITASDDDPDPRLFEVGDSYSLSWTGPDGPVTLANASVIRSDDVGSGGAIVFEGYDQTGALTQLVWAPEVDLAGWYAANSAGGAQPQFFTTDQNPAYTHEFICFDAAARIDTPRGLVPAGALSVGQTVRTWDGPPRPIRWIGRRRASIAPRHAPIRFAPGSIGNFGALKLSPQHRVLIRDPRAELQHGSAEVLVPARALVDGRRIRQVPRRQVTYVHLLLDRHAIVLAEGAPCESLLPGGREAQMLPPPDRAAIRRVTDGDPMPACRPVLTGAEARALLDRAPLPAGF
ncbi:Hint domain-containing protein [Pseudoponticoccus marisrubri]|uniref:Hedgehog/Intein (Hint) domain-containing protein n=1 Tax=Pseudoponticoccus marisrubri TaxID=1685382 RepID=A0A0W7WQ26_9RHOB|nr:Hint domain-containing protein [Pseudoponticoccus marisrubri]KUF12631.1 hypothetical protein AVJ23_02625 [Pseudoponticoccus marisrubri]